MHNHKFAGDKKIARLKSDSWILNLNKTKRWKSLVADGPFNTTQNPVSCLNNKENVKAATENEQKNKEADYSHSTRLTVSLLFISVTWSIKTRSFFHNSCLFSNDFFLQKIARTARKQTQKIMTSFCLWKNK